MTIASLFENVIRTKSELDHTQATQPSGTHGLATELQNKLENLQANEVHTCTADFANRLTKCRTISMSRELFWQMLAPEPQIYELIEDMSTRMAQMTTSFNGMTENIFR